MRRYSFVGGRERDELALPSQKLIEAALSGDMECVCECLESKNVDVNYIGTVSLRVKCIETVLREEEADELEIEYRDFVTDVTPLFAAAHSGHIDTARKLLTAGADVNQELFRGFATTAAARGGHCSLLDMLLKAGASKSACENALMEACLCGQAKAAELLISSEMTGPDVAQHALVSACCRGFVNVVSTLIKSGVDKNCIDRVLLRSVKPALHANVDCTPLIAAIVSRQVPIVKYLLEAGAKTDCLVRLGSWAWDIFSFEELRVGACLGEPYNEAWCAVEYYESSGQILRLLLQHKDSYLMIQKQGRTLLCHAILCQHHDAVCVLLEAGADPEFPIRTERGHISRPIHMAARVGSLPILKQLILWGCDINSKTESGDTALMITAKFDHHECFLELIIAGADLGLTNHSGDSAVHLAKRSVFGSSLSDILGQAIKSVKNIYSSELKIFSLLHFAAGYNNAEVLHIALQNQLGNLNKCDGSGLTPIMIATTAGHTEAFRLLVRAGADISLKSKDGQTVSSLLQHYTHAGLKTWFEQIMLDAMLAQTLIGSSEFEALHFAARVGNVPAILQILKMGHQVNSLDENRYSPLMIAAKEGKADACNLLLQNGADCGIVNGKGESALSLARKSSKSKAAEEVIFDHMAHAHVLLGEELYKHTREGRGPPHLKFLQILKSGILTWGKSSRRNVTCKGAAAGPSMRFLKNHKNSTPDANGMIFRVLTRSGREVHFEACSSSNRALWVRGINLVSREASSSDWLPDSSVQSKII